MNEQIINPGIYEHKGVIIVLGKLNKITEFRENEKIKGVELRVENFVGKSLGSPRFYGDIHPKHKKDIYNKFSTEVELRSVVERQRDGSLRQMQKLRIWLTDFPSVTYDYTSYLIERKDGRKSLISR